MAKSKVVESADPFVRPYEPTNDFEAGLHIFRETADAVLRDAGDEVLTIASHIWFRPYVLIDPSSCFVLDDGTGTAVGYIIGTPNTPSFVSEYRSDYLRGLDPWFSRPSPSQTESFPHPTTLLQIVHQPESLLHPEHPGLMEHYPAHLHIDVLPAYQRRGFGAKLMDAFLGSLKEAGATGAYLDMAGGNLVAEKFYSAVGFTRFAVVLDGGKSGELGRTEDGNLWLVRKL